MYNSKTTPVADHFAKLDLVCKIDANGAKEAVWAAAQPLLAAGGDGADLAVTGKAVAPTSDAAVDFGNTKLVFVLGGPGSGKGTLCERYVSLPAPLDVVAWAAAGGLGPAHKHTPN